MEIKRKNLERLVVLDGKVSDLKENLVDAEPICEPDLFFLHRTRQELEEEIIKRAPENADFYMKSRHSYQCSLRYPNLSSETVENAPEIVIYSVQYWKKK